jgi:hypothetical protein
MRARVMSVQDKIGQLLNGATAEEINQLALACKDAEVSKDGEDPPDF